MPLSDIESRYLNAMAEQQFPTVEPAVEPAGTVRPGAMEGEMSAIPQTGFEALMEKTGATLEQIGTALDGLGKVSIGGIEIGLRDLLPFVGGSEKRINPQTGEEEVVQIGTPEALQKAGRGESLVRGTGFATQLVPDAKLAAFDVPTAAGAVKLAGRGVTKAANLAGDKAVQAITGNPQATAMGVLEEAGQMSPLSRIVPGVQPQAAPQRSDIGFYSAVEKAVLDSKQEKGTGAQFLAQITKTQGVKPEELKWIGLDEFLKGKKSVTKTEIQDYLNANRVDVREVRLGDYSKYGLEDMWEAASNRTKFSQYTLPGGENYREILLTLPARERVVETQVPAGKRPKIFEDTATGRFELLDSYGETRAVFNTRAEAEKAADEAAAPFVKSETVKDPEFYSTHFDQPNILAHMRVNDRVVDGKKTLFIEEIQSDWHQAGRKRGYKSEALGEKVSDEEYRRAAALQRRRDILGETLTAEELADFNDIMARHTRSVPAAQVPDAPFKTSWHELTLKRAIQEASEKGYDQIAITTGKTQAERYDLSKQIDVLIPTKNQDGTYALDALAPGSDGVTEIASNVQEADLERYVGKDLAKKIVDEKLRPGEDVELSGVDLQVGGEGMAGFYDNILPKSLEKLGKKFDAKVGKTQMGGVEVWQMDITPKMRETVTKQGQPLFQIGVGGGAAAGAATLQDNEERM